MEILLTGAVGRLGFPAWRALVEAGHEVLATDLMRPDETFSAFELADLTDRYHVDRLVRGVEAIVHLGNIPSDRPGRSDEMYANNTSSNFNIIEAARYHGIQRILAASSIQVIRGSREMPATGEPPPSELPYLPLDGEMPGNPGNPYGLSKLALESALQWWAREPGRSAVAFRFPGLKQARRPRPEKRERPTPGYWLDETSAWLAMPDAASLIVACLAADLPGYRAYLPAAREPAVAMSPADMVKRYFAGVPCRVPPEELDSLVDISRIERETGWSPRWSWAEYLETSGD